MGVGKTLFLTETVMDPIMLTEFGDFLRRDPNSKVTDDNPVGTGLFSHNKTCNSVEPSPTDTHYRLVCRNCGTILIVPKEVDTYGKLRQWCAEEMVRSIRHQRAMLKLVTGI